ncbi:MAG: HD domain-containing protein [Bacilli bacterium]|nr:HD domain-containing protein [Bacilli bacterium]
MSSHKTDLEYLNIINKYINNENFQQTKDIEHHGITRFEHSLKVSYYSYKVAKALKLDYKETAIGGLLHDFFISDNKTNIERVESVFTHPKLALKTAENEFDLTTKEKDMIRSHMFPLNLSVPKYMESWIVSLTDKCIAFGELSLKFRFKVKYAYNLLLLFMIGVIK